MKSFTPNSRRRVASIVLRRAVAVVLSLAHVSSLAWGDGPIAASSAAGQYESQIKPFLRERCYGCHGALRQEAGLRLDTVELMLTGGDSGPAIEPGETAGDSLLIERVAETDLSVRMPPEHEGEAFTEDQIEMLRRWIAAGAPGLKDEQPERAPEEHWAFRPLVRPTLPTIESPTHESLTSVGWVRNPIDQWIHWRYQEQQLTPPPEASRALLLRRLTLDLIGVLPTAEELDAFENDTADDWYSRAVERLLDDPRHGERWARHWMDNWRYSDWWGLGDQLRNSQRHMWQWRDWIIQSLNDDRGYDEMVRLMLAADELCPDDPDSLRASGYLARNFFLFNRSQWLDETVEHVGKSLLGLTMNCAKCHDHKFDPISQVDYYRMRAFFEPYQVRVDMVPGETDTTKGGIPRAFDANLDAPTYFFDRGDEAFADKSRSISPGLPEILGDSVMPIQPIELPDVAYEPQRHPWVIDAHLADARAILQQSESKRDTASTNRVAAEAALIDAQQQTQPIDQLPSEPFVEDFSNLHADRWAIDSGDWVSDHGRLKQTIDGNHEAALRFLGDVPHDFDASLTFKIHGGQTWKSVGIAFDVVNSNGQRNEQLVYASGVSGGSKVQASYKERSQSVYPGNGAKAIAIELDRDYTMRVQVRGSLVNVFLDDQRVVSWNSPLPRAAGDLRLITYDAIVSLGPFQLTSLSRDVELLDPASGLMVSGNAIETAERLVQLARVADTQAELQLAIDQAIVSSMELRGEAFRAKWNGLAEAQQTETHLAAVQGERYLALQQARMTLHLADQKHQAATDGDREAAEAERAAAEAALAEKQSQFDAPAQMSDPITPFVGAHWTATRFLNTAADDPDPGFPQVSSGRRSALAAWITDPKNPLTARVAVNHLWARHLDQPLAGTTFDLGRNVADPVHPELLDWLACELIESGWSMKHIHRLIVNSATYRMGSSVAGAEPQMVIDPDNRYWWRRAPIRLEAQVVRDSILALANELDPQIGGPSVLPADQATSKRRSLYFFHSNNERNLFLTMFDDALVTECYRREQSIVPQQALALTNSALVLDQAPLIAARLGEISGDDDRDFIRTAFRLILGIDANDHEVEVSLAALHRWREQAGDSNDPTASIRGYLVWALLNHNDFVTLR